jgi:hypothetical protein
MRILFASFAVLFLGGQAQAMSIAGYERTVQLAESTSSERLVAKIAIDAYFQGVAETLTFLQADSRNIYVDNSPLLCFPPNVDITGGLLRAVLDGELKNPESLPKILSIMGKDWKEYQVTSLLLPSLTRVFPCSK